uniref:Uncharacterized protein n=1 Tax=Rhizophora mucronata TaxID=61149 RepID=A0A2P2IMS5_RHIMU
MHIILAKIPIIAIMKKIKILVIRITKLIYYCYY